MAVDCHDCAAKDEVIAALRQRLDDAQLARIEAQNPGIDVDAVRRVREREGGNG